MGRVFFSLYGLILATLVGAGFILDQLVGATDEDALHPAERVATDLAASHSSQLPYTTAEGWTLERLSGADLTDNQTLSELKTKKSLAVASVDSPSGIYYRDVFRYFADNHIIHLRYAVPHAPEPWQYRAILLVVYLFIGLAVFSWLWPLMRDLRRLALQTQQLDFAEAFCGLTLKKTSPLFALSEAFCGMSQRLGSVLASYKEMTYAVSHELRTPLARMKFALTMAQDQMANCAVPRNVQEQWQSLWLDVNEMDALVNQLLNYASFEQENRALQVQTENMQDFLADLVQRARKASPHLTISLHCEPCVQVAADWQLMERVMINLLENAARFAATCIEVRATTPGELIVVSVSDDGPGVPSSEQARVFESFVRLSNPQNSSQRGFGLGLAIVKRLMRWHGGDVSLSAAAAGGACFTLHWPRGNGLADAAEQPQS
ncbi:MAG TPA: ATP-binding protein [Cellvibrionaceae bacterium]|nr:ATP-binding protein [Cellvibrionaceae bacterium]HMW72452.1 ATP-binding protein [Cellvibrionaceae bacterium]HMY37822.1 ATP-binding protein [Marinagarivorans sp.]